MDFLKSLLKFIQTAERPRLLIGFGGLLIGGVLVIFIKGMDDRIDSWMINVIVLFGLALMCVGLIIKSRLTEWGMIDLRNFRDSQDMRDFLGSCTEKVIVLKTWFPEDEHIRKGLETAVRGPATIQMILCDPMAPILAQRTESTDTKRASAPKWIRNGMEMVAKTTGDEKFEGVGLYDAWPGCPVIWADDRIFMGFYFWGHTSPNQPWVEVRAGSKLSDVLEAQRKKLWDVSTKLETLDDLRNWLDRNPPPP